MEPTVLGEALDRRDLPAVGLDREHRARFDGMAVQEDGARAAMARITTDVGSREPELVPNESTSNTRGSTARVNVRPFTATVMVWCRSRFECALRFGLAFFLFVAIRITSPPRRRRFEARVE